MLLYVRPKIFKFNIRNSSLSEAILFGYVNLTSLICTYGSNIIFCDFSARILSSTINSSSLFCTISHVVEICSKKQMFRIHTRGIITFMQNLKALGDRAVMNYPGHSMCSQLWSPKMTITFWVFTRGPQPACFSFINLSEKSFLERRLIHVNPIQFLLGVV